MNRNQLFRPFLILVLVSLALPIVVLGQDAQIGEPRYEAVEVQMPQPSTPLQLGQTIRLEGDKERAAENTIPRGDSIPATTNLTNDAEVEALSAIEEWGEESYASAGFPQSNSPRADSCYTYIVNGGFETNQASWYVSGDVQYVQGGYGTRALYMSTANRQNAFLWQTTIRLPAQAQSMFVRFANYQSLDAGEVLYVQVNNAANTTVLASSEVRSVQGSWQNMEWVLSANQFLGQTVNLVFYLKQDSDNWHSQAWLDNVEFVACNTAVTPTATTRPIDLIMSIHRAVPITERWKYEEIILYAADAIYEMSEGRHYLRTITFYQSGQNRTNAHVLWDWCSWPRAIANGYWYKQNNHKLWMGDRFPNNGHESLNCLSNGSYWVDAMIEHKIAGYALAHELGHYYYGLLDEYSGPLVGNNWTEIAESAQPQFSVMTRPHCAAWSSWWGTTRCPNTNTGNYLYWLNFSHNLNFNNAQHFTTAQGVEYKANAWNTLVRDPANDPPSSYLQLYPRRTSYSELAQVAPQPGQWPKLQLSGGDNHHPTAIRYVAYEWIGSLRENEPLYSAGIAFEAGNAITYPQPALLVAHVAKQGQAIARASLTVQVTAPNGTQSTLTLRDDGIAPDYLINDGQYTAILQYNENGEYLVKATFNNSSGQAAYTDVGQMDVPWTLGTLVGENFTVTTNTKINVTGYTGDDHTDQFANPTIVYSDNQPKRGQIDRAGDKDIFRSTLMGDGKYILRLTSLAVGIQPRLRLYQSDGRTLIGDWTIIPEEGYYYYVVLEGPAGASFFTEISHANPNATQGMYEVSFGPPVAGESIGKDEFRIYLPGTIR